MSYSWQEEFSNIFFEKRVLVTGATGFIGGHLCEALHLLGARLSAIALDTAPPSFIIVERYLTIDLQNYKAVQEVISEIQPEYIFHLAGLVTASRDRELILPMLQNNLTNTVNLLMATLEIPGSRVVITGTAEEPEVEKNNAVPTSPYSASKMAGTLYSRMFHKLYNLPVVIARPFIVYGPRQHSSKLIPHTILSLLHNEQPEITSPDRVCDFIYVLDIVRGLLKIACGHIWEGEVVELGTGKPIAIRDALGLIKDLVGSPLDFNYSSTNTVEYPIVANLQKTIEQVSWQPMWSLEEGLMETISWYSKQNSIS
jgi:UDP-glucose 4-epimerase